MAAEAHQPKAAAPLPGVESGPGAVGQAKGSRPRGPLLSGKAFVVLAAVALVEAAAFFAFIVSRGAKGHAEHAGGREGRDAASVEARDRDLEDYLKVGRAILDLGEIKIPISSTQPRAPRSITATFQVVINRELGERLAGGGGHGGGGKSNPQRDVLVLNVRSILRGMMDAEGVRLIEPSAKADFERRARDRLNHVHIDGDEEKAQVLKVLRGQVLQVIIDKFDAQTY